MLMRDLFAVANLVYFNLRPFAVSLQLFAVKFVIIFTLRYRLPFLGMIKDMCLSRVSIRIAFVKFLIIVILFSGHD